MKFLELKNDGKNDYYELKKDTELYRGDDRDIDIENYYPRFFVKDIEYTKAYGKIIYKFKVDKDLNNNNLEEKDKKIEQIQKLEASSIDQKAKQFADFFNGEIVDIE